jgi:hypothetical protein
MQQLRLFVRVIAFTAFAAVMYAVLLAAVPSGLGPRTIRNLKVPYGHEGHSLSRTQEVAGLQHADILFLGSSLAYRGYDTRIFAKLGITPFNLGSNAQTPVQGEMLLARHLRRLRPSLVVLTLDPSILNNDGVEASLDLLANGPIDAHALAMALRTGHLKTWNTLIHCSAKRCLFGPLDHSEAARIGVNTYVPGGFVERELELAVPDTGVARNKGKKTKVPQAGVGVDHAEMQLAAVRRMIHMLRAEGVDFVIVEPPVSSVRRASYGDHDIFEALMRSLGPYIDMHDLAGMDDVEHFYDEVHLNQRGVVLFNAALIEQLRIKDHLPHGQGE